MQIGQSSIEPSTQQRERLHRFNLMQSVDVHCHCLPGLDDGPPTITDALNLCRALVEDGITAVTATPHQLGRYDGRNSAPEIRRAVIELRQALVEAHVPLHIEPGADVRVDERIPELLEQDIVMTV